MYYYVKKLISQVYIDRYPEESISYISIIWLPIARGLGNIRIGKLTISFWTWFAIGITYNPTVWHIGLIGLMWD